MTTMLPESDAAVPAEASREIVHQRLVLVLPTSGAFDSRTYRIATTCARRGHDVTVLARADAGAETGEHAADGYRVIRVAVDPVDALPLAALWRRLRTRMRRRRGAAPGAGADGAEVIRAPSGSFVSRIIRAGRAVWRLAAIALTVRAQSIAIRSVDPGGDLYHGMAYMGIPVALSAGRRRNAAVVYDARDIYLEARNLARLPRPARWLFGRVERRWAHRASRVVTVNEAYAAEIAARLRVVHPLVVMNCSLRFDPAGRGQRRFHERLGLSPDRLVVLYHGGLFPERGIEELIAALPAIPSADLVLMGYGALATALPRWIAASSAGDRIHLLPAVPPAELHDWVASADVVAMPIQGSTLNHRLTTPNKLFEAMAAGVPVVASDLPGMASIVRETGCGVLCDPGDPTSVATAVRSILDLPAGERAAFGERAAKAADETYNWEAQAEILLDEYGRLTGRPW